MVERYNKKHTYSTATWVRTLFMAGLLMCALFVVCFYDLTVHAEYSYTPVDAVIPFECINSTDMDNASFKIKIKSEDSLSPVPDRNTVTVDNSGKGEFKIKLIEPGTYVYRVYQEKGADAAIVYDESQYDIHVCVMNGDEGKLIYTVSVNYADTDIKPEEIKFNNKNASTKKEEETTEATTEITTEKTSETPQAKKDAAVSRTAKTGDDMNMLFFVVFFISLAGVVVLMLMKHYFGKGGQHESENE